MTLWWAFCNFDPVNHPQEPVGVPLLSGEHAVLCRWGHHSDEVFIFTIIIPGLMGVFSFHFNYGKGGAVCGGILFVDIYIFYYSTLIISVFFAKFLKNAPSNINQNHFYVNYGNEQSGILYGEIWLGSQVLDQSEDFVLNFWPIRGRYSRRSLPRAAGRTAPCGAT